MTSTTNEEALILKADVLGRVRMPMERREVILDESEVSVRNLSHFATSPALLTLLAAYKGMFIN